MPSERIQLLIDVVTGNSSSSLGRLRSDLKNADGAVAKLKVSGSAVGDVLKRNVGFVALGAGAAITTFATKAVGDFQKVALGAGVLRDKLGVTAEEASRLQEVAGDLGIPVATLATTFGRMNKAAADTPSAFDNIGAAIARNQDGTVNTNQTFLNTIDALNRIPDATQRASAAQKIFGRGWAQISELVGMGADDLAKRLGEVEGTKIISDDEIAKAKEMRDRFDDLHDKVEDVTLAVGEGLLPVVVELAAAANDVLPPFTWIAKKIGEVKALDEKKDKGFFESLASGALKSLPAQFDDFKSHFHDLQDELHGRNLVASTTEDFANFGRQVGEVQGPVAMTTEELVKMALAYREAGIAADVIGGKFVVGEAAIREAGKATHDAGTEASAFEGRVQDAAYAEQALATQADEARQALFDLRSEVTQNLSKINEYEKNHLALSDAIRQITSRIDDYNKMLAENADDQKDNNHSADELAGALTGVREAQIGAADQALATATAFAGQNGAIEGSRKFTSRLRLELQNLADANPAIRGEIQKFIDQLDQGIRDRKAKITLDHADADKGADDVSKKIRDIPDAKKKASLDTDDATSAADAFETRLNNIQDETVNLSLNTGDAYTAANNFEQRLQNIPDQTVNVTTNYLTTGQHKQSGGPVEAGQPYIVGEQGEELFVPSQSGTIMSASATRNLVGRSATAAHNADVFRSQAAGLMDEAKALRELAKAAHDADEKEKLLNQAERKTKEASKDSEKADKALAHSRDLASAASERLANAAGREAQQLRNQANALRDQADAALQSARKQADALSEQSASYREAYDAQRALVDVQEQATAAQQALNEANRQQTVGGVTTFVHTEQERADALRASNDAIVALIDAQVQLRRERAESAGQRFTALDEAEARRSLLAARGRRDLIGELGINSQIRLLQQEARTLTGGRERAADLNATARNTDKAAKHLEGIERGFNRLSNGIERVVSLAVRNPGTLTEREIRQIIRRALDGVS